MIIIVGLGNPGLRYSKTRHNVGFMMVDRLVKKYNAKLKDNKKKAMVGVCTIEGQKVALVKPLTFMNGSGSAVAQIVDFYRADPETELIVLCDDVTLPPGSLRIRKKGSAGGHNGLKDIIQKCHTEGFTRIRFGVGGAPEGTDLVAHVLGRISGEEKKSLTNAMEKAEEAIPLILKGDVERAMSQYNITVKKS